MFVSANIRVIADETGANVQLPGLVTPGGVLSPLLDYCLSHSHDRSIEWMTKVVLAVQLFLEYLQVNPSECDTHLLFRNFARCLYTGTFDLQTGIDPSCLAWSARSAKDAGRIITDLTSFFNWLGGERPAAAEINPVYMLSPFDRACAQAAYTYRRDRALLGHTWGVEGPSSGPKVRSQRTPHVVNSDPPAFPDDRFMDLITDGFKVGSKHDYRGILITLLSNGAGFRESEPFHLYPEDVVENPLNPKSALVRIHHPSLGIAPVGWRDIHGRKLKGNRATYLAERFGLLPRNRMMGSQRAGWKGGRHDGKYYKEAYWFLPELGEIFLSVWYKYLHEVAQVDRTHPFAFINLKREPRGEMYTLAKYEKAHKRACTRIGLPVAKALGTTTHGHRHAYGRRLKNAGVSPLFLRKFMHHSSLESQEVYTSPTVKETQDVLEIAADNLRRKNLVNAVTCLPFE